MLNKKIMKTLNLILVVLLLIVIFSNIVFAQQAKLNRFKDSETKIILTNVNRYTLLINKYAEKFNVPKSLLQALMGITDTPGILDPTDVYDQNGAIGLMNLIPFDSEGTSYHYFDCLESGCMNNQVENEYALDVQHLSENQEAVKYEYTTPHSSICCVAYLLEKYKNAPFTYPLQGSDCEDSREQAEYQGYDAAVRRINRVYCGDDNDIYFVERVMQLNSSFAKFNRGDIINYGLLKFVPTFKIKAPKMPAVYDNLTEIISYLQEAQTYAGVNLKFDNLEDKYNITFQKFCEEDDVNILNNIYDNFVNGIEFDYSKCMYPVADEFPFGTDMISQILYFNYSQSDNTLNIKNNLSNDLFKQYSLSTPENFFIGFSELKLRQLDSQDGIRYDVLGSNSLTDLEKIYFANYYNSFGTPVSELIFYKNISGVETYYNSLNQVIIPEDLNMTFCNSSLPNYRLKHFTCLDTKEKEEVYDWFKGEWTESDETIKIKFAFALPRR